MFCLHLHTVIVLYCLDGNEKLPKIFEYPSNNRVFHGPELHLRKFPITRRAGSLRFFDRRIASKYSGKNKENLDEISHLKKNFKSYYFNFHRYSCIIPAVLSIMINENYIKFLTFWNYAVFFQ